MHLQCLPIKKITGARGTLTTLYQTLYIVCIMAILMPACIVWLYYASSSTVWRFSDHFFFCLVCGPLEKKSKSCVVGNVCVSIVSWFDYFACIPSLGCIWAASWATRLQRSIIRAWLVRFPGNNRSLVDPVPNEGLLGELMNFLWPKGLIRWRKTRNSCTPGSHTEFPVFQLQWIRFR